MKQVQKVWAELSAKPQKVDLAKVDDLMQQFAEIVKLDTLMDEAYRELSRAANKTRYQGDILKKDYAKAESQLKDLGIDPNTVLSNAMLGRLNNILKKAEKVEKL